MKKEKIYEFAIDRPLTPAKRKAVEKHIEDHAHLSPNPVSYSWDGEACEVLHIVAEPVLIEVRFLDKNVELYASAPLWARLMFTKQKKAELKDQVELILQKVKFISDRKANLSKVKAIPRKAHVPKTKVAIARGANRPKAKPVAAKHQ